MMSKSRSFGDLLNTQPLLQHFSILENNPNGLTKELVQLLGRIYLENYPAPTGFLSKVFSAHNNQLSAEQLAHCNLEHPYELWDFLAQIIESLPNIKGKLAKTILRLHHLAFKKNIYEVIYSEARGDIAYLPSPLHANQLRGISSPFFAKQFYNGLNLPYKMLPGRL